MPVSRNTNAAHVTAPGTPMAVDQSGLDGTDGDGDADDTRYCFCNGVSYGEMIACDDPSCEREWVRRCVALQLTGVLTTVLLSSTSHVRLSNRPLPANGSATTVNKSEIPSGRLGEASGEWAWAEPAARAPNAYFDPPFLFVDIFLLSMYYSLSLFPSLPVPRIRRCTIMSRLDFRTFLYDMLH